MSCVGSQGVLAVGAATIFLDIIHRMRKYTPTKEPIAKGTPTPTAVFEAEFKPGLGFGEVDFEAGGLVMLGIGVPVSIALGRGGGPVVLEGLRRLDQSVSSMDKRNTWVSPVHQMNDPIRN